MPIRLTAAIVLTILAGYGLVASWPLLTGPVIALDSPEAYAASEGAVLIQGSATHAKTLWLNGAPLLMDESGNFNASLTLPSGGAIVSLTATDRFGREVTERRAVFVN